jgi:lactoylglutathione lyase
MAVNRTLSPQILFETHLSVSDLERSVTFYSNVIGLEQAYRSDAQNVAFFWIGGQGHSMLGLWSGSSAPNVLQLHIAFGLLLEDVLSAPARLRAAGVEPLDFYGLPATEPSVIGWMPAASIFFRDPDQHLLEYIAMLPEPPRPSAGVVTYSSWMNEYSAGGS